MPRLQQLCVLWTHTSSFSTEDVLFNPTAFASLNLESDDLVQIVPLSSEISSGSGSRNQQDSSDPSHTSSNDSCGAGETHSHHPTSSDRFLTVGDTENIDDILTFDENGHPLPFSTALKPASHRSQGLLFIVATTPPPSRAHTGLKLSLSASIAQSSGLRRGMHVLLSRASKRTHTASHVEIAFRDQYLSRGDMWRIVHANLADQVVYQGEEIVSFGTVRVRIKGVFVNGMSRRSGFVRLPETEVVFRSETGRSMILIQMSKEMWNFEADGSGEIVFDKVVGGFLPDLFKRWGAIDARHLVTVILFSRLEYDDITVGEASSVGKAQEKFRDFYRIVVSDAQSSDWVSMLSLLKKEFGSFLREISVLPTDSSSSVSSSDSSRPMISGTPTSSISGNVLEAIHLSSSHFTRDHIDRDLVRTGNSVVLVTPGSGDFEVDYEMLKLTNDLLVRVGVCVELVCLGAVPLHAVPLFRYRYPIVAEDKSALHNQLYAQYQDASPDATRLDSPPFCAEDLAGLPQSLRRERIRASAPQSRYGWSDQSERVVIRHVAGEWRNAVPDWMRVSYWRKEGLSDNGPDGKGKTGIYTKLAGFGHLANVTSVVDLSTLAAGSGTAAGITNGGAQVSLSMITPTSRRETHQAHVWFPRCNMYELQMMGMMENEQTGVKVEGLLTDARFPQHILSIEDAVSTTGNEDGALLVEGRIEMMSQFMDDYDDGLWLYSRPSKDQDRLKSHHPDDKDDQKGLVQLPHSDSTTSLGGQSRLSTQGSSGGSSGGGRRSVEIFRRDGSRERGTLSPHKQATGRYSTFGQKPVISTLGLSNPPGFKPINKNSGSGTNQLVSGRTKTGQVKDQLDISVSSSGTGSVPSPRGKSFWADPSWFAKQLRSSLSRTSAQFLSGKSTGMDKTTEHFESRISEARDNDAFADTEGDVRTLPQVQKAANPIKIPNSQPSNLPGVTISGGGLAVGSVSSTTAPNSSSATPRPKRVAFDRNLDADVGEGSSVGTIRAVDIGGTVVPGSGGSGSGGSGGSGSGSLTGPIVGSGSSGMRGSASSMERMAVYRQKGGLAPSPYQSNVPNLPLGGQGQGSMYGQFGPRHHYPRRFRHGPPSDPVSKVLSPTAAITPWLQHLDPCNPAIPRQVSQTSSIPTDSGPDPDSVPGSLRPLQKKHPFTTPSSIVNPPFSVVRWKSLCIPAIPPLTAPPLPPTSVLASEYEDSVYTTAVRNTRMPDTLLREMIVARLSQGFKIVEGIHTHALVPAAQASSSNQIGRSRLEGASGASIDSVVNMAIPRVSAAASASEVILAIGNTVHYLRPQDSSIEVKRLNRKPMIGIRRNNPSGDIIIPSSADTFALPYRAYIRPPLSSSYVEQNLQLTLPQRDYNWNFIDRFLAGHHSTWSPQLPFWRARFVLVPVPVKRTTAFEIDAFKGLSDEEVRIEGIEKISRAWERGRYQDEDSARQTPGLQTQHTGPSSKQAGTAGFAYPRTSRHSFRQRPVSAFTHSYTRPRHMSIHHSRAPGDSNPLRIHFQTHDPSTLAALTAANSGTLPEISPAGGHDGDLSDAELDETSLDGVDSIDPWSDDDGTMSTTGSVSTLGSGANPSGTAASQPAGLRGKFSRVNPRHSTQALDLSRLATDLQAEGGLSLMDRPWHWTLHRRSFLGTDLTNWLMHNVAGLTDRHAAVQLGNELMHKGLFEHVKTHHPFRDGNFFYRIAERHRKKWWGGDASEAKTGQPSPQPPPLIQVNYYATAAKTAATASTASTAKLLLSRTIQLNADPRRRSDRPEILTLHYDTTHNPDNCYHFRLDWLNVTAKLIEDNLSNWTTLLEPYGLKVVELPVAEAVSIGDYHPFRIPHPVKLAVKPPAVEAFYSGKNGKTDIIDPHAYHKALLRRLGFVLETESASSFSRALSSTSSPEFKVEYSHGPPEYKYTQYIHVSGLLLAQIVVRAEDPEDRPPSRGTNIFQNVFKDADFVLLANRLYNYRPTTHSSTTGSVSAASGGGGGGMTNLHGPGLNIGTPTPTSTARASISSAKHRSSNVGASSSLHSQAGQNLSDLAQQRKGLFLSTSNMTGGSVGSVGTSGSGPGSVSAHAAHFTPPQVTPLNLGYQQQPSPYGSISGQPQRPTSSTASAASGASVSGGSDSACPSRTGSLTATAGGIASCVPPFSFVPSNPNSTNASVVSGSAPGSAVASASHSASASLVSSASASVTNLGLTTAPIEQQQTGVSKIATHGESRDGDEEDLQDEIGLEMNFQASKSNSRKRTKGKDVSHRSSAIAVRSQPRPAGGSSRNITIQGRRGLSSGLELPQSADHPDFPTGSVTTTRFYTPLGETIERSMSAPSLASSDLDIELAVIDIDSSELQFGPVIRNMGNSDGSTPTIAATIATLPLVFDGQVKPKSDNIDNFDPLDRFNGVDHSSPCGCGVECTVTNPMGGNNCHIPHYDWPPTVSSQDGTASSYPPTTTATTTTNEFRPSRSHHPNCIKHPRSTTIPASNPLMFALHLATMNERISAEILKDEVEKFTGDEEWLNLVWEEERAKRVRGRRRE